MRSIRLSLIACFLVLLALALGAVSVWAYQTTHQALLGKEAIARKLLLAQHEEACQKEQAKLDALLENQARALANQAQFQGTRLRYQQLYRLGMLAAVLNPPGYVLAAPAWYFQWASFPQGERSRLASGVFSLMASEWRFEEDALPRHADGQVIEYFQIEGSWSSSVLWRSRSLGDDSLAKPRVFGSEKLVDWEWDDTELDPGVTIRRFSLKVPAVGRGVARMPPPGRGRPSFNNPPAFPGTPPGSRPDPAGRSGPSPPDRAPAFLIIQCACETTERDEALAELQAGLESELGQLEAESQTTLLGLRNRLLAISLTTFAAAMVGGFWLVRAGLSPLRRLSEAVSLVSEKDFRLQLDKRRLPRELRPIVERLTQTLELLKRAFAREKQAAADISHELRTPLTALLTTIEVALRKPRAPEEYQELLAECRASGQQMSQLVERLLTLARLDAGVDTLRPREVDVAALAEQCVALVRPLAEARGLHLHVHGNGPTSITTDADKLREVLTNLLHNAIEYNLPNGAVDVAVERQNGHLQVQVRDTGIGIPAEAQAHIFERFYRADPSRQADGLHAGLGLAIVKGYIDMMGGTISVESTAGQGSTFRVRLPAHADSRN
jgi:heavy metal sensor kinase